MKLHYQSPSGDLYSLEEISKFLDKEYEYEVFVGTDSHVHRDKKQVLYATCIILYKKGKGGRIFFQRNWERITDSLRQRLTNEVWKSLQVCFELVKLLPSNVDIVVDIDLNRKAKYKSSNYVYELAGMITSQGLKCRTKPFAWAASSVADRFSK